MRGILLHLSSSLDVVRPSLASHSWTRGVNLTLLASIFFCTHEFYTYFGVLFATTDYIFNELRTLLTNYTNRNLIIKFLV